MSQNQLPYLNSSFFSRFFFFSSPLSHFMLTLHPPCIHSFPIFTRLSSAISRSNLLPALRVRRNPFSQSDVSSSSPLDYDPFSDLLGIESENTVLRNSKSEKIRSWFGPNGQYIRELPCPNCRARGYTPCTKCGIDSPKSDCSSCNGKGKRTCKRCGGDCVIWEEKIDERPWEKARSRSPIKVKEDDLVDKLEIKLDAVQKSNRFYKSVPPQVRLKISQTLKSLNAKTGLFSNHMKMVHQDPVLRAQRIASIKKTKGTAEARKKASEDMKEFFINPENRIKRSLSMKGVKFYCSNCGQQGHRKFYCPILKQTKGSVNFKCSLCGKKGHNKRTCSKKT
ncbi:hypothetical protein LUZ60_000403 [Juncus effusus]|nr:hypothetical protein LUZ60_000403 [Juncus effusus]